MAKYLKQKLDSATFEAIADFICGDSEIFPEYRSSGYITRFFNNLSIYVTHDGSTRKWWVLNVLKQLSLENLEKVVLRLVDIREYKGDKLKLEMAQRAMSDILFMENMDIIFQGRDPVIVPLKISSDPIIQNNSKDDMSEEDFLKKDFEENNISKVCLGEQIENILTERIVEAQKCLKNKSFLSCIFMAGSTLEGLLLGVASKNPRIFNQALSAPKKDGKVKNFPDWTLDNFINVAHEVGFIDLDVKKFSHAMKDFRNYIHPYQQLAYSFKPDEHTAKICLQVLNAAISDLIRKNNCE